MRRAAGFFDVSHMGLFEVTGEDAVTSWTWWAATMPPGCRWPVAVHLSPNPMAAH